MNPSRPLTLARLWDDYGLKLIRFGGVTVVSTIVGFTTLAIGLYVFNLSGIAANLASVVVSTPPSYYLNRRWVWGHDGESSVAREVTPFWILTLLGFVVSTIAIGIVDLQTDSRPLLLLTQVASFGGLWLVKFAFLEKVLWGDDDVESAHETFEHRSR